MLSDFNNNTHKFNYDTEYSIIRNNYYLIDNYLLSRITSYKVALQKFEERIKIEYMCWHTGKSIKYNEIEYEKFDIKDINDEIENNRIASNKNKKWQNIRKAIIERDDSICVLCGDELNNDDIHIHHIEYRKHGGNDSYNNLVTLCIECHGTLPEHDKVIEFGYRLSPYYSKINQNKRITEHIKNKNKIFYDEMWIDTLSSNPLIDILGKDFYSKIILDKNLLSEIFLRLAIISNEEILEDEKAKRLIMGAYGASGTTVIALNLQPLTRWRCGINYLDYVFTTKWAPFSDFIFISP